MGKEPPQYRGKKAAALTVKILLRNRTGKRGFLLRSAESGEKEGVLFDFKEQSL